MVPIRSFAVTLAVGALLGLSACARTPAQYEYAIDIVSPTWESRIDLHKLQPVLDERGEQGWELVTLGQALLDTEPGLGTVAVFKRPAR